ncbi:DSD1 family PLP-dependent enzyme [Novosphingobium sp.]|uniref:DSD1 family PLP-dependent enzyme n=1 Tax=Novosphingobium sp. TaxID=1874826 RepID=UPI0038B8757E
MTDDDLHRHLIDQPASRDGLNTPVLLIDRGALDRNIAAMARFVAARGLQLRPHAKTHKSHDIARRQIDAGAVGICCAKLGEAEAMADNGVTEGILLTSPVVTPQAIARLMALNCRTTDLICVVDNPENVRELGKAAHEAGKPLRVIIDIDPGIHRTGVATPDTAVALLDAIGSEHDLHYAGVQFYCGAQQHIPSFDKRRNAMETLRLRLQAFINALTEAGGGPGIVTGGGTGTHRIDPDLGLFTELQAGSYVFMDAEYAACDLCGDGFPALFETALLVDARVVSANTPGLVTLDAGLKAFSSDAGVPTVVKGAPAGATYRFMGDEHGALLLPNGGTLPLGHVVTLATPHCDPTVNLHDTYHVIEGETLRALWPVTARGRSR